MSLNKNRLNFPNMVNRHLDSDGKPLELHYNPLVKDMKSLYETKEPGDIDASLNNLVASVHNNLREIKLAKANARRTAREQADLAASEPIPLPPPKGAGGKKAAAKSEAFLQLAKKNDRLQMQSNLSQLNTRSISQIKASFEQKFQQRMRRQIGQPNDINNFTSQKRLREVLQQKHILEDILREHEKIQRDRNSIALEIQTMKDYLSEIRCKLDISLKKLGKKKTVVINSSPQLKKAQSHLNQQKKSKNNLANGKTKAGALRHVNNTNT